MQAVTAYGALNELVDPIAHPQRRQASVDAPHGDAELSRRRARASLATAPCYSAPRRR